MFIIHFFVKKICDKSTHPCICARECYLAILLGAGCNGKHPQRQGTETEVSRESYPEEVMFKLRCKGETQEKQVEGKVPWRVPIFCEFLRQEGAWNILRTDRSQCEVCRRGSAW